MLNKLARFSKSKMIFPSPEHANLMRLNETESQMKRAFKNRISLILYREKLPFIISKLIIQVDEMD
jgi:hypothetical protein